MHLTTYIPLLATLLSTTALAIDKTANQHLVSQLRLAATQLDRLKLLSNDSDWLRDFTLDPKWRLANPGSVVNANAATFPAVTGYGMTVAILNLGPCSMLPAHLHPRASNFVVSMSGTTHTYMQIENGARVVETLLTPGKMTIFPAGSVHAMENTGCVNAQLVSSLNSEDTGTHNIANALFDLPDLILAPGLGYADVGEYNETRARIPPPGTGSVWGNKECMARCEKEGVVFEGRPAA